MLVLSREVDERIFLDARGLHIEITVVRISTGKVRLGIEAPIEVAVLRDNAKDRPEPQYSSALADPRIRRLVRLAAEADVPLDKIAEAIGECPQAPEGVAA